METGFDAYLRQIGDIPLLDSVREHALGQAVQLGLKEQRKARPRKYVLLAAKNAQKELIYHNLRWVVSIAKKYKGQSMSLDDLVEEGNLGLMKAAERFNPDLGRFSTHSAWWIRQAITRALADRDSIIRKPVHAHTTYHKIRRAELQLGGTPTDTAIATHLGASVSDIEMIHRAHANVISLDREIYGENSDQTLLSVMADEAAEDPIEEYEQADQREQVAAALARLNSHDRQIIMMRFGFEPYGREHTLEEIGKMLEFPVTRERVRQLEAKLLRTFRTDPRWRRLAS